MNDDIQDCYYPYLDYVSNDQCYGMNKSHFELAQAFAYAYVTMRVRALYGHEMNTSNFVQFFGVIYLGLHLQHKSEMKCQVKYQQCLRQFALDRAKYEISYEEKRMLYNRLKHNQICFATTAAERVQFVNRVFAS